jgi:hypothetical protein
MTKDILRIEGNIDDVCDMVRRLPVFNHAGSVTLRDQFAMAALIGALAGRKAGDRTEWAKVAYELADAMMEARK